MQRGVLLINEHLTNFLPRWPHEKRSYTPLVPAIETRRKILIASILPHEKAAAAAGISPVTVWRWLKNPKFQRL